MLEVMYDLPDADRKTRHVVTRDAVAGKAKMLERRIEKTPDKKSA
jgi:hypothetical protein